MNDILATTVQAEWWASQAVPGQGGRTVRIDASEGQSRAYFAADNCKRGVCDLSELFNYLSGYQPWRIGSTGGVAGQALRVKYGEACLNPNNPNGFQSIACGNPLQPGQTPSAMTQAIEDIFNPSPLTSTTGTNVNTNWAAGAQLDRPWQWFTCNTLAGTGRAIGSLDTQVWNRFSLLNTNQAFEVYTLGQDLSLGNPPC
jgi:hypothetical protein